MTAVCESDGQWTPNPGGVTCSLRPTQTFTQAATPTQTSTPTGPGENQLTQPCTITLRINLLIYLETFQYFFLCYPLKNKFCYGCLVYTFCAVRGQNYNSYIYAVQAGMC